MSAAKAIEIASGEVGVTEDPPGSNRGPRVGVYQAVTSLARDPAYRTGWPWCAAFVQWVWTQAGVETDCCSASTEAMWLMGRAKGWLSDTPLPGCAILWRGVHTGIVVAVGDVVVETVEGNSGDQVARRTRAIGQGETYLIPPSIRSTAGQVGRVYWLEDTGARPRLVGPWRTRAWAEARLRRIRPGLQPRLQATTKGRWGILTGPRRRYGPWATPQQRDRAAAVLEKRLGHPLRPYSTPTLAGPVGGAAEAIGKTT